MMKDNNFFLFILSIYQVFIKLMHYITYKIILIILLKLSALNFI